VFVDNPQNWFCVQGLASALLQAKNLSRGVCLTLIDKFKAEYQRNHGQTTIPEAHRLAMQREFSALVNELLIWLR
jgi:hypothetical protein